ncbi:MAG: C2H2-type zinc finger protein [Nitrososphaerota archaeon]|nr:C2H2-type zinc finger protein [Nitrososphaerota archaeon]MDG6921888.1 C2H2-type zinc finger protein [Nitrososphaerota archaeon]
MITLRADAFSEKQLAEIALAIQNRWEVPTFVKIREIVIVDEDVSPRERQELSQYFERGLANIFQSLGLADAFRFVKTSKNGYSLDRIPGSDLPKWMSDIEVQRNPENENACPHCGRRFRTDIELSMHTKLHYLT